jgi:hypothetical protein
VDIPLDFGDDRYILTASLQGRLEQGSSRFSKFAFKEILMNISFFRFPDFPELDRIAKDLTCPPLEEPKPRRDEDGLD